MKVLIWLAVGGVVVWLTVLSMSTGAWRALQQNIVVGIAGAILGGYLLGPLLAVEVIEPNFVGAPPLVMAAIGAFSLLKLVKWLTLR